MVVFVIGQFTILPEADEVDREIKNMSRGTAKFDQINMVKLTRAW